MSKFRFIIALSLFIIFTTLSVNAVESYVQRKYIDSNTWTDITTAYKTNQGGYAEVKILEMYKADGSTSNYTRLNVRIG